jgi:hypothetical protein
VGRCACDEPFVAPDCNIRTQLFAHLGQVRDLAEESGVLWVSTTTGLWALDFAGTPSDPSDDSWAHFDELVGASHTGRMVVDPSGTKWFAGDFDRQLVRMDDGGTPLEDEDDTWYFYAFGTAFSPRALGFDDGGNLWLGRVGETLTFSDAGTPEDRLDDLWRPLSEYGAPESLIDLTSVDVIGSETNEILWLGSEVGGLFAYDTIAERFAQLTHPSWSRVYDLVRDRNTLWVAVDAGDGVPEPWQLAALSLRDTVFDVSDDDWTIYPATQAIETFDVDAGGRVWASGADAGLACLDSQSAAWSAWGIDESIQSILTRSASDLWLGTQSVFYLDHGGSCAVDGELQQLVDEQTLRSEARDVAIEGDGVWLATDRGVDYLDTGATPFDREDDRWIHFDEQEIGGLSDLQGVLVGPQGIKYFWGQDRVFAFDDQGTPFDRTDDSWVGHDTDLLWVSGVVDTQGRLLVVARPSGDGATPRIVVFDPGGTPNDAGDDEVLTIESGLPGVGRNMTLDTAGQVWLGTETNDYGGNLYHWDRSGTPLDGNDDVWTPVRDEDVRVWKLEADPTGGVWGTVRGGVFHFYDGGTPTDLDDDYWHLYSELGSAMDIGPGGDGWFRMPGGAGILDVGGTPRDPSDDVARLLLSPDALRFQSDLWTNGTIDDQGRFWVVDEYVQVFEYVE